LSYIDFSFCFSTNFAQLVKRPQLLFSFLFVHVFCFEFSDNFVVVNDNDNNDNDANNSRNNRSRTRNANNNNNNNNNDNDNNNEPTFVVADPVVDQRVTISTLVFCFSFAFFISRSSQTKLSALAHFGMGGYVQQQRHSLLDVSIIENVELMRRRRSVLMAMVGPLLDDEPDHASADESRPLSESSFVVLGWNFHFHFFFFFFFFFHSCSFFVELTRMTMSMIRFIVAFVLILMDFV
jgi:hypothetical protein